MPIHNWKSVDAGIFHAFHQVWSTRIMESLNDLLPPDHYAVVEQIGSTPDNGRCEPDVVALQTDAFNGDGGGVTLAPAPRTTLRVRTDSDIYAAKKNIVSVRHVSGDRIVAIVELLSPGNKSSRYEVNRFVNKIESLLLREVHVLIADLFPPSRTNPGGIHEAIWNKIGSADLPTADPAKSLVTISYEVHDVRDVEAYIEPLAIGDTIPDMPVFLRPGGCVMLPLEATYTSAYAAVPLRWRRVIEAGTPPAASPG